jgi:uncharacterized membrane protein YsdA (DUF1294 family)
MEFVYAYLIIINALGAIFMLVDKIKAIKNLWRIPERAFFAIALLGGSLGVIVGMRLFRHKTLHPEFSVGIPLILIGQILIALVLKRLL